MVKFSSKKSNKAIFSSVITTTVITDTNTATEVIITLILLKLKIKKTFLTTKRPKAEKFVT